MIVRAILVAALFMLIDPSLAFAGPSGMTLEGVNISGAEWAPSVVPGVCGTNYIYPTTSEFTYFSSKGMSIIRVPFLWERMQPQASGALDPTELSRLDAAVSG